jgi:hypothetical protein
MMCKHVAAVLYGVGARLDDDPNWFFVLRKVNINDHISDTISKKAQTLLEKSKTKSRRVFEDTDISDMFGIEMEEHLDNDRFLIAPCGMNCRICAAFLRVKNKCLGCRGSDLQKPITRLDVKLKPVKPYRH